MLPALHEDITKTTLTHSHFTKYGFFVKHIETMYLHRCFWLSFQPVFHVPLGYS